MAAGSQLLLRCWSYEGETPGEGFPSKTVHRTVFSPHPALVEAKEFRSLRRAAKGSAFGIRKPLKRFDRNFFRLYIKLLPRPPNCNFFKSYARVPSDPRLTGGGSPPVKYPVPVRHRGRLTANSIKAKRGTSDPRLTGRGSLLNAQLRGQHHRDNHQQ